jgi:hypothetical protein
MAEGMYIEMSRLCSDAQAQGRTVVVSGDFNAVVGTHLPEDPPHLIGEHGFGERNDRGQQFVDWATADNLMVLNTRFRKLLHKQWTHQKGMRQRLIEYHLCEKRRWLTARNVEATSDISVGIDHRCVRLDLRIELTQPSRERKRCRAPKRSLHGWTPTEKTEYQRELDAAVDVSEVDNHSLGKTLDERCSQIEDLLLEVGRKSQSAEQKVQQSSTCLRAKLYDLIAKRKQARDGGDKASEIQVSKLIQRETRAVSEARKRSKIDKILEQFRDLKHITGIKAGSKRAYVGSVVDAQGEMQTDRQKIADTFADFYAQLYASRDGAAGGTPFDFAEALENIPPVTVDEVRGILKSMANRKYADARGVVVELLKNSSDAFSQTRVTLFNDILSTNAPVPSYWQQNLFTVLFKKGDPASVENYRPITILPILYTLFSKTVCARVKVTLEKAQSVEQAGFRSGFSCDDHLFVITLLSEMFAEFRRPLWGIAVDF